MKKLGISLMPETDFVSAIYPLLNDESIDVVEWSFDTFFNSTTPIWLNDLLDFYSENNRLIGHGVYYSLFDAKWTERQNLWLEKLKAETSKRKYNHITEHFGFMNTENFHQGVPLPVSLNPKTLQIGKDRIQRLQNSVEVPIGIENLAFSFSKDDIKKQGEFIGKLIDDVDGFVLLDLHNLYCQSCNFEVDLWDLIKMYPLGKVREIHLSGGSWQESVYAKNKLIRRDTHDDSIPEELFIILPKVFSNCPNLEYVIIERLGNTFSSENDKMIFSNDFRRVKSLISDFEKTSPKSKAKLWSKKESNFSKPIEDNLFYEEQVKLTKLLFESEPESIKQYQFQYFETENWDLEMINTAKEIIKKWNPY